MARASAVASRGNRSIETDGSDVSGGRRREVAGILLLGASLFLALSVGSLQLGAGTLMGPCGAVVGLGLYALFGVGAYLLAGAMMLVAVRCLVGRTLGLRSVETAAAVAGGLGLAILIHLALGRIRLRGYSPGGLVGEYGAELMASVVGRVGAVLLGVVGVCAAVVMATSLSTRGLVLGIGRAARATGRWMWTAVAAIFPEKDARVMRDAQTASAMPIISREEVARRAALANEQTRLLALPAAKPARRKKKDDDTAHDLVEVVDADIVDATPVEAFQIDASATASEEGAPTDDLDDRTEATSVPEFGVVQPRIVEPVAAKPAKELPKGRESQIVPTVVPMLTKPSEVRLEAKSEPKLASKGEQRDYIPAAGGYHLPDLDLLDVPVAEDTELDRQGREEMLALAEKLQRTLADYGVKGQVQEIHPGPVVTMYEFVPAAGTKLSKITGLSNDLAMALAALKVRIVAPIPGKSSVGIEVPNKKRATVYLREILGDDAISRARSRLTMGLGKDISGAPVAVDLAKMPHLLVAGTTGSGKSVGINGMICSILFGATPDEVRMIMIDPKMVELSVYEGIPHLLLPVVTDPKKANLALRWAVEEMERRYESVSKAGVRDLVSFNKRVEKLLAEGPPAIPAPKNIKIWVDNQELEVPPTEGAVLGAGGVVTADVRDDISAANAAHDKVMMALAAEPVPKKLPYIVVIIDEFADLMMVAPKDVETSVARIAQKARAVGIHLIVATQRPSVDVITGLIKANFPSRIGFQVASKIDSRTILDQQGAENLLGNGDSLFTDRGQALKRIHGAFVSDDEVKRVVAFLQKQGKPVYDMEILKPREDDGGEEGGALPDDQGTDPLYDQAVRLVCDTRMASVSMIQRRLQIGFNRASRLVERMEKDGLVGAANGSKPREVLAQAV